MSHPDEDGRWDSEIGQRMAPSAVVPPVASEPPPPPPPSAGVQVAHNSTELAALDRCEHGRHKADNCSSCPGGQSTGNLYLKPGQRIGTTLYGDPIIVPEREQRWRDSFNWVPGEHRRVV